MNAFQKSLSEFCQAHLLDEKILVAPTLAVGRQITESLARQGQPWVNLRVETFRTIAMSLMGADLAASGKKLLSRAQSLALVEQACIQVLDDKSYFGKIRNQAGFHRALQQTLGDLRVSKISENVLTSGTLETQSKASEISAIASQYEKLLKQNGFVDANDVLMLALEKARSQPSTSTSYYLVPDGLEASCSESDLLAAIAGERLVTLPADSPEVWCGSLDRLDMFSALGEENEIREVFRRLLWEGLPFDSVELIYTDTAAYVPLIYELTSQYSVPCTFAQGIPVTFTRPGQAALAFLQWIESGYAASTLREKIAEGCIDFNAFTEDSDAPSVLACATAIREAEIGWGRERYLGCIDRLIAMYDRKMQTADFCEDEIVETADNFEEKRRVAGVVKRFLHKLIERISAAENSDGVDFTILAAQLAEFLGESASVVTELDAMAVKALSSVLSDVADLPRGITTMLQAVERLKEAVAQTHVNASNPKPGHIHVSDFRSGGYSGRERTFVVGLDDSKHPGRDLQDPVLLDSERTKINQALGSEQLSLLANRPVENAVAMRGCLARVRGSVTLCFSCRNLADDSEMFPSAILLEAHRALTSDQSADYSKLLAALPRPAGFFSETGQALDETEWWLSSAFKNADFVECIRNIYPWLKAGETAENKRQSPQFTVYDGRVDLSDEELVCSVGDKLSASQLELLAKCPYAYFVKYVLGIEPLEERVYEPTKWLDSLEYGNLLHELFKRFMEALAARGEKPSVDDHLAQMKEMAQELIEEYLERIPPPNDAAFKSQRDDIMRTCLIFLKIEEDQCKDADPCYFELSFGYDKSFGRGLNTSQPVSIDVGNGKSVQIAGRIDRIDKLSDGRYAVWDYKTGSARYIKEESAFDCGRHLQHALYAYAVNEILSRSAVGGEVAESGYLFPGVKGEGSRIVRTPNNDALRAILSDLVELSGKGAFIASSDDSDCKFCGFGAVCGKNSQARSKIKLECLENVDLEPMRRLRNNGR